MDTIKIANEVVAVIAALAAMEVDGVKSMAGNITNEMIQKLSKKSLSKGRVSVVLMLNIDYNASIPKVSENVQNRVKNAIESMTDLCVLEVVVKVAGVSVA